MAIQFIKDLVDTFGNDLPKKLADPTFFIEKIIFNQLSEPHSLQDYHKQWLSLAEEKNRVSLMASRGSGKTFTLLVCYPIFKAFTNEGWTGVIISSSLKQSMEVMKTIRDVILNNPFLRTALPLNVKSATFSKTEIELKNKSRILCRPFSDNIRGIHPNWLGADEIGEYTDHDIWFQAVTPIVNNKDGSIIAIGTPTSGVDLLHTLEDNKEYYSDRFPALDDNNRPLWPDRFSKEKLNRIKREIGSLSFAREYMLEPVSSDTQVFPENLIGPAFDYSLPFTFQSQHRRTCYIGADMAISTDKDADYTVYTIVEKDSKSNEVRVLNIERYKALSYAAMKHRLKELCNIYRPYKVLVDENNFGEAFMQDMKSLGVPIDGFKFTRESKIRLVQSLRNMFENNLIRVNALRTDPQTNKLTKALYKELLSFGWVPTKGKTQMTCEAMSGHDDMVMSLALSCWLCRSIARNDYFVAGSNIGDRVNSRPFTFSM